MEITYSTSNDFDEAKYTFLLQHPTELEHVAEALSFLKDARKLSGAKSEINKAKSRIYEFIARVRGEDTRSGKNPKLIKLGLLFLQGARSYHGEEVEEVENKLLGDVFWIHDSKNSRDRRTLECYLPTWPSDLTVAVCGMLIVGVDPVDPHRNEEQKPHTQPNQLPPGGDRPGSPPTDSRGNKRQRTSSAFQSPSGGDRPGSRPSSPPTDSRGNKRQRTLSAFQSPPGGDRPGSQPSSTPTHSRGQTDGHASVTFSQLSSASSVTGIENTASISYLLNYDQSFETSNFLHLLYSLGGTEIPQEVVFAGLSVKQELWVEGSDIGKQLAHVYSSPDKLKEIINACVLSGLLEQSTLNEGSVVYSVRKHAEHLISSDERQRNLLALLFTAYICPSQDGQTTLSLRRQLLPHLDRAWEFIESDPQLDLPNRLRISVVEASLATCVMLPSPRAEKITSMLAERFDCALPDYLRVAIAVKRSVFLRFMGKLTESDIVLDALEGRFATDGVDVDLHCSHGRLLCSRAENAIQREEFDKASSYLESWVWVPDSARPSMSQLKVVRLKNTAIGRVLRYKGNFKHSCDTLEHLLTTISSEVSDSGCRYHVIHHLADVYCELGRPKDAQRLVLFDVTQLRSKARIKSKPFRRLALPLAEAYLLQGMYSEAETTLQELIPIYRAIVSPDASDQLGHVRSVIGLARVSSFGERLHEARYWLEEANRLITNYETFVKDGFYVRVIGVLLSKVRFKLEREELVAAHDFLQRHQPQFFMPGIGSYVLSDLVSCTKALDNDPFL